MKAHMQIKGLEFVEIATAAPAQLEALLLRLGFQLKGKHRSKNVTLYRQGEINLIINAGEETYTQLRNQDSGSQIKAIAVKVEDARTTYDELLHKGAWSCNSNPGAMELNIPGIEIIGGAELYLINNYEGRFSIYDIDFTPVNTEPAASPGLNHISALQLSVSPQHQKQWLDLFTQLLMFKQEGNNLISPDGSFRLEFQLLEKENLSDEGITGLRLRAGLKAAEVLRPFLTENPGSGQTVLTQLPYPIDFEIQVELP